MSLSKVPKLYDELYEWIDRGPLVEAIISTLWETDLPLDVAPAKHLWYRVLGELPELLSRQARVDARLASKAQQESRDERRWEKV